MGRLQYKLKLLVMVFIFCGTTTGFGYNIICKEVERNQLLKLKHSFDDQYNLLDSWVGDDCCNWDGVACDNLTSNVVELDMVSFSLLNAMEVSPALLEFKHLTYLGLSLIDLNGSTIPEFLGSMTQLQHLDLSFSNFGGEVPQNLGNLTKLVHLDLSRCMDCYSNNLEWASKLENLQYLDLSGVDLSRASDSLHLVLPKLLPSLRELRLSGCQLANSQLATKNLSTPSSPLQYSDLSLNSLSGPFPTFLQNSTSIAYLDLSYNKLSSSVPSWLANKRELEYVDLSNNQFDRVEGGIMNTLGSLCSLYSFDLSHNLVQEEVSEEHANISRCSKYDLGSLYRHMPVIQSSSSLSMLDLSQNNLETIPLSFGSLSSLNYLNVSYNHLSVVHQATLGNLSGLVILDISSNPFFFDVSPDWIPPFQLYSLDISISKLNGPFPQWLLNQSLIGDLSLSDAEIFGPLPDNIGNAMPYLINLRLPRNRISGSVPKSLCNLAQLSILDLQKNRLSGMIPDCWDNTWGPSVMELSSNTLSGAIPNSLTKIPLLQLLSLDNNSLVGELPDFISTCDQLAVLDVGRNNLHGKILHRNQANSRLQILILRENRFKGVISPHLCSISELQVIDLAKNNLTGTIPRCFGHFGDMGVKGVISPHQANSLVDFYDDYTGDPEDSVSRSEWSATEDSVSKSEWSATEVIKGKELEYTKVLHLLVNMDLSYNNLVGEIPPNFKHLSGLISLNLSHNHLSGSIPREIGEMTSLESLDLSRNNLSGSIPESVTFLTFLSKMNLSFNNLHGKIPVSRQLQTLDDAASMYRGNPGLCGDPLPKKCFSNGILQTSTSTESFKDDEEEDEHEKIWFYMVIIFGFASGFWGVIGILVVKRRWRNAYFGVAEEIGDWLYVRVALWIAKVNVSQASCE